MADREQHTRLYEVFYRCVTITLTHCLEVAVRAIIWAWLKILNQVRACALRMREIMAKKLSRIARLSQRIFGEIPRELEYR